MTILPEFQLGVLNGWLALFPYFVSLLISVRTFSKDARQRLFEDPKYSMPIGVKILRILGQMGLISYIVMMLFTPLRFGTPGFGIGLFVYTVGYVMVMSSLNSFRTTAAGQPVDSGFYRWSRNPQWVGLAMVLFGSALMTGVLLYLGIVFSAAIVYHLQIVEEEKLCLRHYGDSYRAYMENVPRYLFFF